MKNGKAQTGGRLAGFLKKNNMVLLLACGGVLTCLTKSPELLLFVMPEEIKLKKYY